MSQAVNQAVFEVKRWHTGLLLLLGLLGPPVIGFFHLILAFILRSELRGFPDVPIEFFSLMLFLTGLPILLHRRGAPVWMLILTLVISGFIALMGGLVTLFVMGGLTSGLPKC